MPHASGRCGGCPPHTHPSTHPSTHSPIHTPTPPYPTLTTPHPRAQAPDRCGGFAPALMPAPSGVLHGGWRKPGLPRGRQPRRVQVVSAGRAGGRGWGGMGARVGGGRWGGGGQGAVATPPLLPHTPPHTPTHARTHTLTRAHRFNNVERFTKHNPDLGQQASSSSRRMGGVGWGGVGWGVACVALRARECELVKGVGAWVGGWVGGGRWCAPPHTSRPLCSHPAILLSVLLSFFLLSLFLPHAGAGH